jgi:hypothetical protein
MHAGRTSTVGAQRTISEPSMDPVPALHELASLAFWRAVSLRRHNGGSAASALTWRRLRTDAASLSRYLAVFSSSWAVTGKLQMALSPRICRAAAS